MTGKVVDSWHVCRLIRHVNADGSNTWEWSPGEPVTDEEVHEVQAALRILEEESEQRQLNLVLANFKSFFEYWRSLPSEWQRAQMGAVNPTLRLQTELATRLFNWLQSFRAYLDHTQRRLTRQYGRNLFEVAAFKEATSKEFDEHFSYRFFSKLRNYGHVDFPAIRLEIDERAPIGRPREMSAKVGLRRDVLLANFREWGPVKRDLEQQAEVLSLVPLMTELMESLERIKGVVGVIEHPMLAEAVGVLDKIRARLADGDGYPHLLKVLTNEEGTPTRAQMIPIPPYELPQTPSETGSMTRDGVRTSEPDTEVRETGEQTPPPPIAP